MNTLFASLVLLLAAAASLTAATSGDFVLKGDPCSKSDLCDSKTAAKTCSCDPDCRLYGTCCQDAAAAARDAPPPDFRCYDRKMVHPVFAKRACSEDFRGHVADRLACFDDDEDEMDVANNLLVTSRKTKVVYWNRHCARCSNEAEGDLELWNIEVLCPRRPGIDASLIRRNLTFDPDQKKWGLETGGGFHQCFLDYSPPSFVDQVKHCTPNIISSCPDNYTVEGVVTKCSQYYGERRAKNSNVVYKNIHCAICGAASVQDLECPGMSAEELEDHEFGEMVEVTFFGGDWLEKEPGKAFECSKGYVYDPARKKCRSHEIKEEPVVAVSNSPAVLPATAIVMVSAVFLAL